MGPSAPGPGGTGVTTYTISRIGIVYLAKVLCNGPSIVLGICVIHYIMRGEPVWGTYREMSDISRNE
jgi:hypothetical protein